MLIKTSNTGEFFETIAGDSLDNRVTPDARIE